MGKFLKKINICMLHCAGGGGGAEKRKADLGKEVVELQSSPGSHRRQQQQQQPATSPLEPSKFFTSRYHDYAEILSDEENGRRRLRRDGGGGSVGEEAPSRYHDYAEIMSDEEGSGGRLRTPGHGSGSGSTPSSTSDMQDLVEKLDSKLESAHRFYLPHGGDEGSEEPEPKLPKLDPAHSQSVASRLVGGKEDAEGKSSDSQQNKPPARNRTVERVPANSSAKHLPPSSSSSSSSPPSTQVVRRRAEYIPSDTSNVTEDQLRSDFPELAPRLRLGSGTGRDTNNSKTNAAASHTAANTSTAAANTTAAAAGSTSTAGHTVRDASSALPPIPKSTRQPRATVIHQASHNNLFTFMQHTIMKPQACT
jgi:hypothetical protein